MSTEGSQASTRIDHWSELTGEAGTGNAAIDATKAAAVSEPLTDATNGRYMLVRNDGDAIFEALAFAATGADNATFKAAVWGWARMGNEGPWVASKLLEITGTLGTLTGVSGHDYLDNTWRFPDAITVDENNCPDGTCEAWGGDGGNNDMVALRFDAGHFPILEIELSDNASATAVRCWRAPQ